MYKDLARLSPLLYIVECRQLHSHASLILLQLTLTSNKSLVASLLSVRGTQKTARNYVCFSDTSICSSSA